MAMAFDNELYLERQTEAILSRTERSGERLYLEFGGKLLFDHHAARVLPGYDPNGKMRLLSRLKEQIDIILCVHAGDIERRKVRADFGITYDADSLKLIDDIREWRLDVRAVVITRYDDQPSVRTFINRLKRRDISVYTHRTTKGYPTAIDTIVSRRGYGANPYVAVERPIVVVTGPGPGSGKMATCLAQIYHEHRQGTVAGYAKFETFPIWNLPLKHPVNLAYEAATADIGDDNQIDPFHLDAYSVKAVNYNRDVEVFPIVQRILRRIQGDTPYRSPTDMGVNCVADAILDDAWVKRAATQEVVRRLFRCRCEYILGLTDTTTVERIALLMEELDVKPESRRVVIPARKAAEEARQRGQGHGGIYCGAAIELADGSIVTGKNSALMHAASSMLLNAIKQMAGLPDKLPLLTTPIMDSMHDLKSRLLQEKNLSLNLDETLIALSISATSNPAAQLAMEKIPDLRGCEVHLTHIPTSGDETGLKKMGVNATSDPSFTSSALYSG